MGDTTRLIAKAELREFFRSELAEATEHLGLKIPELTEYYVVNLLSEFARQDAVGVPDGEPLVFIYQRAAQAEPNERAKLLRKLGDVALYVSGFFAEFVERSLVDLSYYISMGGHAYRNLSGHFSAVHHGETFSELYGQLAVQFPDLVDALHQVSDRAKEHTDSPVDLLRLYDRWVRTGSKRSRRLLVEQGLVPAPGLPTEYCQ